MSSRVHFRFSSSTDFDFVLFNGEFITVGELKYLISKKTGVLKDRNTVIELFDSRTEEEYTDANTMIAKNASVLAKRSPAIKAPIISTLPSKAPVPAPTSESPPRPADQQELSKEATVEDEFGPDAFAPDVQAQEEVTDDMAISELVKGFGRVWKEDLNAPGGWGRGRMGSRGRDGFRGSGRKPFLKMGRPTQPPFGYICHRCNRAGHYIDECPTNGDPTFDIVRVRYPTGIPSTMLVKDDQGGLLMPNGERARLRPNTEKFRQEMEGVPGGDVTSSMNLLESGEEEKAGGKQKEEEEEEEGLEDQQQQQQGLLDNKQFMELSALLCNNPLSSITPLVMNVLPRGQDDDIRKGFFNGHPLNEQSFQIFKEEYNRDRALFEDHSRPNSPTHLKTHPSSPKQVVEWREGNARTTATSKNKDVHHPQQHPAAVGPPETNYQSREASNWNRAFNGYAPPSKSIYDDRYYAPSIMEMPQPWHGNMHQHHHHMYDPYYGHHPRPLAHGYVPEYPPPRMMEDHLNPGPVQDSPSLPYDFPTHDPRKPMPHHPMHSSLPSKAVKVEHPTDGGPSKAKEKFNLDVCTLPDENMRQRIRSRSQATRSPSPRSKAQTFDSPRSLPYGFGGYHEDRKEKSEKSLTLDHRDLREQDGGLEKRRSRGKSSRSRSRSFSHREEGRNTVRNEDKESLEISKRRLKKRHESHRRKTRTNNRKKKRSPEPAPSSSPRISSSKQVRTESHSFMGEICVIQDGMMDRWKLEDPVSAEGHDDLKSDHQLLHNER